MNLTTFVWLLQKTLNQMKKFFAVMVKDIGKNTANLTNLL
jgi:hypothetical protein